MHKANQKASRGFTLLELIIVIAILAILSVAVVLVINPAETLARARDSQRLSDLAAMKSAIGLYLAEVSSPDLAGGGACATEVWIAHTDADITDTTCGVADGASQNESGAGSVDGTGWLPVNLTSISSGAPLSNWPLDPVNDVAAPAAVTNGTGADHIYVYRCDATNDTFEISGNLESTRYANTGTDDKESTDGGDQTDLYEVGTDSGLDLCSDWGA